MTMRTHTDPGVRVTLSAAGRALAYDDNALRQAAERNERLTASARRWQAVCEWALAIALGMILAWGAVDFGGMVS
jgi:hypothetical protein